MSNENDLTKISNSRTVEEMIEFWDAHSTADFHDQTVEVDVEFDATTRFIQGDVDIVVERYRTEEISLAKCASLAGVSFDRMKEILIARGVTLHLGPETLDEAQQEVDDLQRMRG